MKICPICKKRSLYYNQISKESRCLNCDRIYAEKLGDVFGNTSVAGIRATDLNFNNSLKNPFKKLFNAK